MPVQFLEQKSTTSPDGRLSTNYLKCKINDIEVEFPYMNATKQDFDKSSEVNPLQSQHFQFFVNELSSNLLDITTECRQNQIATNFLDVIEQHEPVIKDIVLYYNSHEIGKERRDAFLDLQIRLNTTFLSDIEFDKNQSFEDFQRQLQNLDSIETEQIKSPTINMITPIELFKKKLELILENNKYDRFNVEWGSQGKYFDRWLLLSKLLSKKKIICNVVSINQKRNYYEPFESYIAKQFMIGAHSCSTGYYGGGDKNEKRLPPRSFILNENNWYYEEQPEISYNLANTLSHNTLSKIAHNSRQYILNDTYFSKFVPQNFQFEST